MERSLEKELLASQVIKEKCKVDKYAQNLYASLCNMQWQPIDVIPILKDEKWSCSWRHAGGVVAEITHDGDYMTWYCSGIGAGLGNGDIDGIKGYVGEGTVTEEIQEDLKQLGWYPIPWNDDD
jgi:hypothetical protein